MFRAYWINNSLLVPSFSPFILGILCFSLCTYSFLSTCFFPFYTYEWLGCSELRQSEYICKFQWNHGHVLKICCLSPPCWFNRSNSNGQRVWMIMFPSTSLIRKWILLENLVCPELFEASPYFMEPEISLACPKHPTIFPAPSQMTPTHNHSPSFFKNQFRITLLPLSRFSKLSPSFRFSHRKL